MAAASVAVWKVHSDYSVLYIYIYIYRVHYTIHALHIWKKRSCIRGKEFEIVINHCCSLLRLIARNIYGHKTTIYNKHKGLFSVESQ